MLKGMDGILLVDKPKGWTSFDVVAKIRGILARHQSSVISHQSKIQTTDNRRQTTPSSKTKVGHTGTLDPLATGLLVILIGSYTKKAPELTKLDKTYEVTMKLGATSTTGDAEGAISLTTPTISKNFSYNTRSGIILKNITEVMKTFVGEGLQTPPAYSAIKVNGQRAYKLARQGKDVKLEPRKVTIYEITNIKLEPNEINSTAVEFINGLLEVKFTARVSSGTYIRSLVEDIGKKLGAGAYMSDLRRTQVGKFDIKDALSIDNISLEFIYDKVRKIQ